MENYVIVNYSNSFKKLGTRWLMSMNFSQVIEKLLALDK